MTKIPFQTNKASQFRVNLSFIFIFTAKQDKNFGYKKPLTQPKYTVQYDVVSTFVFVSESLLQIY